MELQVLSRSRNIQQQVNNPKCVHVQSELEDLCFAILHPDCYQKLHEERNNLWALEAAPSALTQEADKFLSNAVRLFWIPLHATPFMVELGALLLQQREMSLFSKIAKQIHKTRDSQLAAGFPSYRDLISLAKCAH